MVPIMIEDLPNEILFQVLSYLDHPAPSDTRLHDQPSATMLASEITPLKDTAWVCKRWRALLLPLLYQHIVWSFDPWDLLQLENQSDIPSAIGVLALLRRNSLTSYVQSFTMIVGDRPTLTAGSIRLTETGHEKQTWFKDDYNWLWRTLFAHLDPARVTFIAPPRILASMLSRMIYLGDAWSFMTMTHHVLSLSIKDDKEIWSSKTAKTSSPSSSASSSAALSSTSPAATQQSALSKPSTSAPSPSGENRTPCDLFALRPWNSILVNEGSSTHVYKTYEFFLKRPPSLLPALLGSDDTPPNDTSLLPPSIRDFSYVGIFPLSSHFATLIQYLPKRLDRLFVQLVPRTDIDPNSEEMRKIDTSDLWMERNTSYSLLMRELFDPAAESPWLGLRVFESGDAADREAWRMAVHYVEYSGVKGWRVESEGVFQRYDEEADTLGGT
jgi:hypothetical protein